MPQRKSVTQIGELALFVHIGMTNIYKNYTPKDSPKPTKNLLCHPLVSREEASRKKHITISIEKLYQGMCPRMMDNYDAPWNQSMRS